MSWVDLHDDLLEIFSEIVLPYRPPGPDGKRGSKLPLGMHLTAYPGRMPRDTSRVILKPRIKILDRKSYRIAYRLANAERIKASARAYRIAHREERKLEKRLARVKKN